MKSTKNLAAFAALCALVACGGGGGDGNGAAPPAPTPTPSPPPTPTPTPAPPTGLCQSSSDHIGTYQCVGKDVIVYQAGGFVTFVGNISNYVNTSTGETKTQGPTARLCSVTSSQGQWYINTPYGNFNVPAQDEMVTTYKPAFLQDGVAGMQTLMPLGGSTNMMFSYTTTTNRNGGVTRMGILTRRVTETSAETFTCELTEGASVTPPPPAPPPSPAPRACTENEGPGMNGLTMSGRSSYTVQNGTASITPGTIAFNNPSFTPSSTTGSLRMRLFAVEGDYFGGAIQGYVLSTFPLRFNDGTSQLRNGQSSQINTQSVSISKYPPNGNYCMVIVFEEYRSSCTQNDKYCIVDWTEFGKSASF